MDGSAAKNAKQWLDENRAHFLELSAKMANPKRLQKLLLELYQFLDPVLQIEASSPPHAAMFAVGQVKAGVESVFEEFFFYEEYKRRQIEFERLIEDESGFEREHSANPEEPISMSVT